MNFENCESFVIPFCVQKASVWKRIIQYLCEKETTPVEAICNSHVVSIDKEYYPVEQLEINYTARWNAVSIFKERWTEQETHYEPEIHYFDRFGNEHKHAGFDYFDAKSRKWKSGTLNPIASRVKGYSGDANTRPWTPREVTVTVTENIPYERETGRQKNSGDVMGSCTKHNCKEIPFLNHTTHTNGSKEIFQSLFSDIISDFTENEKIPYSEEAVRGTTVIKQSNPLNDSDMNYFLSEVKSEAKKQCIQNIPGQAYADFRIEFDSNEAFHTYYYPIYHVIYEFKKQKYECFVSGCQKNRIYGKHNPEDVSIENIKQQYDSHCSDLKDRKKKCWLKFIWIWLGLCAAETFVFPFLGIFISAIGNVGIILVSLLPIVLIGVAIYLCWNNYKNIKNIKQEIVKIEEAKKNVVPVRQAKKQAIMDIVLNDNLSDSEKAMRCETILKQV